MVCFERRVVFVSSVSLLEFASFEPRLAFVVPRSLIVLFQLW